MRLFCIVLLSIGTMNHYANAQALPANPWAAGAVETYVAPTSETATSNTRPSLPNTRQSMTSINENLNVLREYFSDLSAQTSAQSQTTQQQTPTQPQNNNNDALMQFLHNIIGSGNSAPQTNTVPQAKSNVSIPNPVADAEAAYNQYMSDLRRKIDDTTRKARNSYNNAVSSAKDAMKSARKNLLK